MIWEMGFPDAKISTRSRRTGRRERFLCERAAALSRSPGVEARYRLPFSRFPGGFERLRLPVFFQGVLMPSGGRTCVILPPFLLWWCLPVGAARGCFFAAKNFFPPAILSSPVHLRRIYFDHTAGRGEHEKGDGNMKGAIRYEHRRGKQTGRLWTAS